MISKTYYRYIWLLDTLLTSDSLTFDEINMLWEDSPMYQGALPLRTFHEHRKGIQEMFGVDIGCKKRGKDSVYYVKNPEALKENKLGKWLLENYSIPQDFVTFNRMRDRIVLEEMARCNQDTNLILEAMMRNVEMVIDYQRHEGHHEVFHVRPYALKVYNRRWYLLGFIKERGEIRNLALDRMQHQALTDTHFDLPNDFDARKYYANVVGIFVDENKPVTKVKIRAYGVQVEYLRSLPIHKSLEEVFTLYEKFSDFTYRLCITPELISILLSMGDKVEVLDPQELREDIKKIINNMFNLYK